MILNNNAFEDTAAWLCDPAKQPDIEFKNRSIDYQNTLSKPPGSLGDLEKTAVQFSAFQSSLKPILKDISIHIFAADHGVCSKGVSAFPQIVTTQMIENFVRGGAAISVLSRDLEAKLTIVNMGTANPLISQDGVIDRAIAPGTRDFTQGPAMTLGECLMALSVGRDLVSDAHLFIGGEMGIGNTTSASAIYSVLLGLPPGDAVGPGTGVCDQGLSTKREVVAQSIAQNNNEMNTPLDVLRCLGGFEVAALVGSYIAHAQKGVPILIDGFISTAAALVAIKINPTIKEWLLFSHCSAEPAHTLALSELGVTPMLNLGMRLGEGSGAAVAVRLIQSALLLHNEMATFSQAGVSEGE